MTNFVMEENNRDYKDRFDVKFNTKAYGNLDDATSEWKANRMILDIQYSI